MTPTKEAVLKALGTVQEPDLGQDLVTLNMIRNLNVSDQRPAREQLTEEPERDDQQVQRAGHTGPALGIDRGHMHVHRLR